MYFIVGLGNPGNKYEYTKHNVGFKVIDELSQRYNIPVNKLKFKSLYGIGEIENKKVMLIKPQTYMNNSGISLIEIYNYYNPEHDKIIVIVDDIDIEFGSIRIKKKGSAGSHNGMKSIIYHLQFDDFIRIKLSIGKKNEYENLADFVLSGFKKEEISTIEKEIELAHSCVVDILTKDINYAMNRYNSYRILK